MSQPEDVEELKARIAVLESERAPKSARLGCAPLLGLGTLCLIGLFFYSQFRPFSSSPPAASTAELADEPTCNASWSQGAVIRARASLIRDMAVRKDGFRIVVSTARWSRMSLDQRDQLVSAVDCSIAGPGYLKRIIVETSTGEPLKSYTAFELRDARRFQPKK